MNAETNSTELARRLTEAGAGAFHPHADAVTLDDNGDVTYLQIIDAGSGRTEQVIQALRRARQTAHVPVIVGRRFSAAALAELDDAQANYMDDRNLKVRLLTPHMLIRLQDGGSAAHPEPRGTRFRLSGAAGGVALALLLDPMREWKVTDLAEEGRASLGATQNTLVGLESEGLIARSGRGPATRRRVTDRSGLLDRYAQDAVADRKVLARGFILNNGAEETMNSMSKRLSEHAAGAMVAFTGVAAAQLIAPHITAVRSFEAWVTTPHRADFILGGMGAMPADEGANVVLLRGPKGVLVGAEVGEGIRRVSAFRMYADTRADPVRGEEQAEFLRETVIGF